MDDRRLRPAATVIEPPVAFKCMGVLCLFSAEAARRAGSRRDQRDLINLLFAHNPPDQLDWFDLSRRTDARGSTFTSRHSAGFCVRIWPVIKGGEQTLAVTMADVETPGNHIFAWEYQAWLVPPHCSTAAPGLQPA